MRKFDWSRSLDPAYLFGYGIYAAGHYTVSGLNGRYNNYNDILGSVYNRYNDRSIEAYEWREKHKSDPVLGYFWGKANERDLYAEKEKYQEDLKKNTGHNWKNNAYPRLAYGSAFGGVSSPKSPLFEVNDAIMALYNGVRKW